MLASRTLRQQVAAFAALPGAIRRRFAAMALPWLVAFVVGFPLLWHEVDSLSEAPQWRARENLLDESVEILRRTLDGLLHDAAFLSDLSAQVSDDDLSPDGAYARLFLSFSKSSAAFDRVRWLDGQGNEQLRVEAGPAGPRVAPLGSPRDNRAQPFFAEALRLPRGTLHLSDLALDMADGQVVQPHEPVLLVSMPFYRDARAHGVIAISYRASRLLDRLSALAQRQGMHVYLANDDGYWLQGPTPQESWAWQLKRPDMALARTAPALWRTMLQYDTGRYSDDAGDWAFRRLRFNRSALGEPGGPINLANRVELRVVVHSDPAPAGALGARWQLALGGVMALLVLLALRFGWHSMSTLIEEERQAQALRATNRALVEANGNLRRVRAELERAERLSALGLMVAGVAHELNTPLGSATLALSTLQQSVAGLVRRVESGLRRSDLDTFLEDSRQALELAQAAVQRAASLLQRFKQVAVDRSTMERREFDLAEALLDSHPDLRRWDPARGIALHLDLKPGLRMLSYPGPLEQVVANLINNALIHAFRGRETGTLTLRASASGPDHVVVHVADDGIGVDTRNLKRIFDPFYTTNRHAGGTGLGLHIAAQLVTEVLGGSIRAQNLSTRGTGMVFTLRLPRVVAAAGTASREAPAQGPAQGPVHEPASA